MNADSDSNIRLSWTVKLSRSESILLSLLTEEDVRGIGRRMVFCVDKTPDGNSYRFVKLDSGCALKMWVHRKQAALVFEIVSPEADFRALESCHKYMRADETFFRQQFTSLAVEQYVGGAEPADENEGGPGPMIA